ncbi:PIN domain-containing protein [Leptolyngbya sp. GB1-A1]|uniref:PIN domain-containing protein n=1 Tax=Leptolyngbya sp. GB1-A1 TaxID=2933908 RepID=UPI003296A1B5
MKILVDTNIILDFLLEREPFLEDAAALFQAIESGLAIGYATATTLTNIFYIARRHTQSIERARQAVRTILAVMRICPVNRAVLRHALEFEIPDFEDAVQIACAFDRRLDAIVTRDLRFAASPIRVLTVRQLLEQLVPTE